MSDLKAHVVPDRDIIVTVHPSIVMQVLQINQTFGFLDMNFEG